MGTIFYLSTSGSAAPPTLNNKKKAKAKHERDSLASTVGLWELWFTDPVSQGWEKAFWTTIPKIKLDDLTFVWQ